MKLVAALLVAVTAPMAVMVAAPVAAAPAPAAKLTLDSPIETIAADAKGKAALTSNFPGLLDNPMYSSISSMTLKQLQPMAPDKMSDAQLAKMAADLAAIK